MELDSQSKQRCTQLYKLGLKYNGAEYIAENGHVSVNVHWTEITCSTEAEWNKIISAIKDWNKKGVV